jgi:hypothetical protein
MTSAQVLRFSRLAMDAKNSCYGEPCDFNGTTITVVCEPLNDVDLAAGGFEQNGLMRVLISGVSIPSIHDRLGLRGKTWIVRSKTQSLSAVETGFLLEAVSGVRDL